MDEAAIDRIFTYHPPHGDQAERYETIRTWTRGVGLLIIRNTPASPEQTLAIRHLQQAVMFANAAIAIHESDETSNP